MFCSISRFWKKHGSSWYCNSQSLMKFSKNKADSSTVKTPFLLCREKSFCQNFREVFDVFASVFKGFVSFSKFSDLFGPIRICSDLLGRIRMHSDTFASVWKFSEKFGFFLMFELFSIISDIFWQKTFFTAVSYQSLKKIGPFSDNFQLFFLVRSILARSKKFFQLVFLVRSMTPSILVRPSDFRRPRRPNVRLSAKARCWANFADVE